MSILKNKYQFQKINVDLKKKCWCGKINIDLKK